MPQETLGYVRLEWTCPSCGSRNPGPQKACSNCGAPQPQNVAFQQAAEEQIIADQAEVARAAAGPDVHCPYCDTRNPAGAERCKQCGGGLVGAQARASGQVLGAHRAGPAQPLTCAACGATNPGTALKCGQCGASLAQARPQPPTPAAAPAAKGSRVGLLAIAIIAALAVCAILCIAFSGVFAPAKDVVGQVRSVAWTRTIAIQQLAPVSHEDWRDSIPSGATLGSCSRKVYKIQKEPAPGAEQICGTPYTVDQGSGYGKVVQDCQYKVYADWCSYTVQEWLEKDRAKASGTDLNPSWPNVRLGAGQREGQREEKYQVVFVADDQQYTYETSSAAEFARCQVGSRWTLKVKGSWVVSIQPQ